MINAYVPIEMDLLGDLAVSERFQECLTRSSPEGVPPFFLTLKDSDNSPKRSPDDLRQETVQTPFGISPKWQNFPATILWVSQWGMSGLPAITHRSPGDLHQERMNPAIASHSPKGVRPSIGENPSGVQAVCIGLKFFKNFVISLVFYKFLLQLR